MILAKALRIDGKQVTWTLGNYARLIRKSPECLQFGVAVVPIPTGSDDESEDTAVTNKVYSGILHATCITSKVVHQKTK